ncbi:hypothetical protein FOA43_000907 [Brettanomyces nanus]|uniref:Thioredoxin domain-containing protein n=1 Tax=Eeniella nana TaxID=13502 RepID=A0A875RZW6_EENNA|nr:uncharacterized protein FOA43_000907 [Brettanomyces nanus]QPG73595.1 hypothetical protein FOA43_000907 [Brettanomyces nanus]
MLRVHILFALLTLCGICLARAHMKSFYAKSKYITELTPKSFDDVVLKTNHTSVVEFYAPWCQYCMKFKRDYTKASKMASGFVQFGAVDCNKESNKPLCAEYKVQGFPTVMIFRPPKFTPNRKQRKHSVEVYKEERNAMSLVNVLKGRVKNYVTRITAKKLDKFFDLQNAVVNRTLLISEKSSLSPVFKSLSIDFLGSLDLGYVNLQNSDIKEALLSHISELGDDFEAPKLIAISKEEGVSIFQGDMRNKLEISRFLANYGTPGEGPMSERGKIINAITLGKAKTFKEYNKNLKDDVPVKDEL